MFQYLLLYLYEGFTLVLHCIKDDLQFTMRCLDCGRDSIALPPNE